MNMETVLVTGAAGFIGPQVVRLLLQNAYRVIVLDKLTYAARVDEVDDKPLSLKMELQPLGVDLQVGSELSDIDLNSSFSFLKWDIYDPPRPDKWPIKNLLETAKVDYVINLAAESHVDRSTGGNPVFIQTEILGTHNLLEAIFKQNTDGGYRVKRAVFVGTDEVYGSIDRIAGFEDALWYRLFDDEVRELVKKHQFTETTSLDGGSLYAGCKGGADLIIRAYFNQNKWDRDTGKIDLERMPVIITRGVNNFGPYQHPEKLIPLAICTLLDPVDDEGFKRRIPVYDRGLAIREWLHTEDHARAIIHVMRYGQVGEIYNIGSGNRCRNRDLLLAIFRACKDRTPFSNLTEATFDATTSGGIARPGHDLCYAVNCTKLHQLGWRPERAWNFEDEIRQVVEWYKNNEDWWKPVWKRATEPENFLKYWNGRYKEIQGRADPFFSFYTAREEQRELYEALL